MRPRLQVIILGILSLLLYLFLTQISKEFNWGEGYADRPILTYLAIYFSLSLLFFAVCTILSKQPEDRFIFWIIIVFGLVFRFSILPAQQIQEDDIYRYLWDGKVFSNNINPFELESLYSADVDSRIINFRDNNSLFEAARIEN